MKISPLKIVMATMMTFGMAHTASAGEGSSVHVSHQAGVKVYRAVPTRIDHQAAASYKTLELQELQIQNQNRQAAARLRADTRLNQQRLELDRRIAFTDNQIFLNQGRRSSRRFVTRGFNNRFYGVNGISRNSRISKSFD